MKKVTVYKVGKRHKKAAEEAAKKAASKEGVSKKTASKTEEVNDVSKE